MHARPRNSWMLLGRARFGVTVPRWRAEVSSRCALYATRLVCAMLLESGVASRLWAEPGRGTRRRKPTINWPSHVGRRTSLPNFSEGRLGTPGATIVRLRMGPRRGPRGFRPRLSLAGTGLATGSLAAGFRIFGEGPHCEHQSQQVATKQRKCRGLFGIDRYREENVVRTGKIFCAFGDTGWRHGDGLFDSHGVKRVPRPGPWE